MFPIPIPGRQRLHSRDRRTELERVIITIMTNRCLAFFCTIVSIAVTNGLTLRPKNTIRFRGIRQFATGSGIPPNPTERSRRQQEIEDRRISHLEYLDSLSGKKFRRNNVVKTVIDTSDEVVSKLASQELA